MWNIRPDFLIDTWKVGWKLPVFVILFYYVCNVELH